MLITDWIGLGCAILSLVVTILIGCLQIRQNARIDKLTEQQLLMDEQRYRERVDIEARQFLSKYNYCIGLLPLCAIAFSYDENRAYSRDMYSDFRLLSKDVRNKIFEKCGWTMCDVQTNDFFHDCLMCFKHAVAKFLPCDNFNHMFYDNGKYVSRAIKYYGNDNYSFSDVNLLTDIIAEPFQNQSNGGYNRSIIDKVIDEFGFRSSDTSDVEACTIACLTAKYIAIYSCDSSNDNFENYGSPGAWAGEKIETMEDLFLSVLFEIWSNIWCLKDEKEV